MKKRFTALLFSIIFLLVSCITASAATVDNTGSGEYTEGAYTYTINADGTTCTIVKYTGTEETVTVPEILNGYTVTSLKEIPFDSNLYVKSIYIPKTVTTMGTYGSFIASGAKNLENIYVDAENPVYYDVDGILYKQVTSGIILSEVPAGKQMTSFRIPANVSYVGMNCFVEMQNLKRVIIPDTVKQIHDGAFMFEQMEICLLDTDSDSLFFGIELFYNMYAGTKLIVPNDTVAAKASTAIYPSGDSNVEIINLANASEDVKAQYTTAATAFTFTDQTSEKKLVLSTGGTFAMTGQYTLLPADCTENITWTISNEVYANGDAAGTGDIGTIDCVTGLIQAKNLGTFTVMGTTDSGYSISVFVTVYQAVESVELYCGTSNPDSYAATLSKNNTKWISFCTTPERASNWDKTVWVSSNPTVATVQKDDTDKEYALLTFLSPGTTTITATLDDNGTIFTKSFVLTVTKDLLDCTIDKVADQNYTGSEIKPDVALKDGSKVLVKDVDYQVSYTNNTAAGTATAVVTALSGSNYSGSKTVSFVIIQPANTNTEEQSGQSSSSATETKTTESSSTVTPVTVISKKQTLKVSSKNLSKNVLTVAYGSTATVKGTAKTTISYQIKNSKIASVSSKGKIIPKSTGITTLTVTAKGTSSYTKATKTITVIVVPKKEAVKSLKSMKKAQFTVSWKKDSKASGYQIQYSTSSKFTSKTTKTVTIKNYSTTSQTIKKLVKGKKYYVRVRAYKIIKLSGKSIKKYGSYSIIKTIRIRK